jgi:hypothetical protein
LRGLLFVKTRKEQDVERMLDDCPVMAIWKSCRRSMRPRVSKRIGVRGLYTPKVSLSRISSVSDHTSRALNHGRVNFPLRSSRRSVWSIAIGLGISSRDNWLVSEDISASISLDVAVTNGFSYL